MSKFLWLTKMFWLCYMYQAADTWWAKCFINYQLTNSHIMNNSERKHLCKMHINFLTVVTTCSIAPLWPIVVRCGNQLYQTNSHRTLTSLNMGIGYDRLYFPNNFTLYWIVCRILAVSYVQFCILCSLLRTVQGWFAICWQLLFKCHVPLMLKFVKF